MRLSALALLSFAAISPVTVPSYAADPELSSTIIFDNVTWLHWANTMVPRAIRVTVDDQVSDGCWKSPQATRTAVELELQRSGFIVSSDDSIGSFHPSIVIRSLGFRAGDQTCVVSVRLDIMTVVLTSYSRDGHMLDGYTTASLYNRTGVLIAPLADVGNRIKESHVEFVQDFLVNIKRKQIELLGLAASSSSEPTARSYWEDQRVKAANQR